MVWLRQAQKGSMKPARALAIALFLSVFSLRPWTSWGIEPESSGSVPTVCIVIGAEGELEYGKMFQDWQEDWNKAAEGLDVSWIGQKEEKQQDKDAVSAIDREALRSWIAEVEGQEKPGTYWLILIGHGTYDGKQAKFNMRGMDVSASELGAWLSGSKHQWVIAVCASCSGPFIQTLSKEGRIIITSTKSGSESNFSRFGGYLAQSATDPSSDLDHDASISVLESFLSASRKTERYYQENKLLATEHGLLDDNGDGKGTSVDFYRGLRPIKRSEKGAVDGDRARSIWFKEPITREALDLETKSKVTALETQIEQLRSRKGSMELDSYYSDLERLLRELAQTLYPASK